MYRPEGGRAILMDKGTAFGTMAASVAVVLMMCMQVETFNFGIVDDDSQGKKYKIKDDTTMTLVFTEITELQSP